MNYKKIELQEYGVTAEIVVLPDTDISQFLSKFKVSKAATVSKKDYEDFLRSSLVKNKKNIDKKVKTFKTKREKTHLEFKLIEAIYQYNKRLLPSNIVLTENSLVTKVDALRQGKNANPKLNMNEGWVAADEGQEILDYTNLGIIVQEMWSKLENEPQQELYESVHVDLLNINIPVLNLEKAGVTQFQALYDYVLRRCFGDFQLAKQNYEFWSMHLIMSTIPYVSDLMDAVKEANYVKVFTEKVIFKSLYTSIIKVNADFSWDNLNWHRFASQLSSKGKSPRSKKLENLKSKTEGNNETAKEVKPLKLTEVPYETFLKLSEKLKERVVGQDEAIEALSDSLGIARVGLKAEDEPVGGFLLAGTTGVGKTELAKALADSLGTELIRIDCSEYQSAHEVSKIFGSPPGYVGYTDDDDEDEDEDEDQQDDTPMYPPFFIPFMNKQRKQKSNTLVAKIRRNPFSVVLFDEIEEADPALYKVLLQILDDARATSGSGKEVSFSEAIILMTSNLGTKEASREKKRNKLGFGDDTRDFEKVGKEIINRNIDDRFADEFLNRLTEIIIFNQLSKDNCKVIIDLELSKTKEKLEKEQHFSLIWDENVKDLILNRGFSKEFGARNIRRTIKKEVDRPLSKFIMECLDTTVRGGHIILKVKKNKIEMNVTDRDGKKNNSRKK